MNGGVDSNTEARTVAVKKLGPLIPCFSQVPKLEKMRFT